MKWFLKALSQYADFSGRASRKEFWMFVLFNIIFSWVYIIIVMLVTYLMSDVLHLFNKEENVPFFMTKLFLLYYCIMLIPGMALTVRRLHDTGRSGWMMLVSLIPFVGGIWLFVLSILPGNPESNKYGSTTNGAVASIRKTTLKEKALFWLIAFTFFNIVFSLFNIQEMISNNFFQYAESSQIIDFCIRKIISLWVDVALIVMGIGFLQQKDYSRTIAVWLLTGWGFTFGHEVFRLFGLVDFGNTASIFYLVMWLIIQLTMIVYACYLFVRKGKDQIALYSLISASVLWIIVSLVSHVGTIRVLGPIEALEPDYFLSFLLIMMPVSLLLYGIETRKENT